MEVRVGRVFLLETRQSRLIDEGVVVLLVVGDESPYDTGRTEEDWRRDGRVVVPKLADQGSRGECTGCTSNLVHDVHDGIHLSKLLNIATDNVSRDDSSNELDHTVGDTGDDVDRE